MQNTRHLQFERKSVLVIIFSLGFAVISGIVSGDWLLGGAILFCGLLQAYFAAVQKRINYAFGLLSYILMSYVAFRNGLYGTGGFYALICAPLQIQGFVNWSKNAEASSVKTRRFNLQISLLVIVLCVASSTAIGFLLSLIPGQQLSFLDAASNCVNLCGIVLMNLRYMEAWWLWLVNNILDLTIWALILLSGSGNNATMMFITCVMYLAVNVYGIWRWLKSSRVET